MSRLIIASNRISKPDKGKAANQGGLAVAILAALRKQGGVWFGWSGTVNAHTSFDLQIEKQDDIDFATVDLSEQDYQEYYNGFANSTLWPLFHYRLDLAEFDRDNYRGYIRVNQYFAGKLGPLIDNADDLVWIHDYHLIPMAELLRQMGVQNKMGFFLHTPFPGPEILLALPQHENLVRALCAYDLVGFQTKRDRNAFVSYLINEARAEFVAPNIIRAFGRLVQIEYFPISIETEEIHKISRDNKNSQQNKRVLSSLKGQDMIIGVDRLDYSKGLPNRFLAFEKLLQNYAENRNKVVFMQIAPPSRAAVKEYQDIRHDLELLAGHINGGYADFDWVPIRYLNKGYPRPQLLSFFRLARIGLVTPLRDGMNLVAKEYVAAQNPTDPGVLILSRFAGAASELACGALLVNPYDIDAISENIQRGLNMSLAERQERYAAMMEVLTHHDIYHWRDKFIERLKNTLDNAVPIRIK